ncbi:DEAD/DEAH box helicase [Methanomethylophilus alvi]|uniref:DEAD/DEAH box helicase n=1 Tax=Methanomethylophilus alvi TaxID=1291540 RepID=UPI0037DCA9D6
MNIVPFDFQENAIQMLLDKTRTLTTGSKGVIIKSPTGSGKTLILQKYIDRYLSEHPGNKTAFVWFCPGAGELEEQSKQEMELMFPGRQTSDLNTALTEGFPESSTTFINWEQVDKKNNRSISESEKRNLFEQIKNAHLDGIKFIVIVDEEHSNDTVVSRGIIDSFSADYTIRVSATADKDEHMDWYEIDEDEVIRSGLITKAIWINPGVNADEIPGDPNEYLIKIADEKRKQIQAEYKKLNLDINPLVIIQFPSNSTDLIKTVEKILLELGYDYNRDVASYMSDSHINVDHLKDNNGIQTFLLIKQAISTGWNCPRSKILVKLRENMSDQFTIQTIGRIRRMPQAKHYENDILDNCYLYTFDDRFKMEVVTSVECAYDIKRLKLRDSKMDFSLEKEMRSDDYKHNDPKKMYKLVEKHLIERYKLSNDKTANKLALENNGYKFADNLQTVISKGKVTLSKDLDGSNLDSKTIGFNSSQIGNIEYRRTVDELRKLLHTDYESMNVILMKLFLKGKNIGNLLSLNKAEFHFFVANNEQQIKEEIKEISSFYIKLLTITPKKTTFRIPIEDFFKFDPKCDPTKSHELVKNVYQGYTDACLKPRSRSESLFEQYCESCEDVEWVYKNGDSGIAYFSILYQEIFGNQRLFYPDYIVKKSNGEIWIVEAKGGESPSGENEDNDPQSPNKFEALKEYAKKHGVKFGFVRSKIVNYVPRLYFSNTEYKKEMAEDCWVSIDEIF